MSHARVMPSKLHLTVPCPGSLQLQEKVPPAPHTREQAEGDLGHIVARKHAEGHGAEWPLDRKVTISGHEFEIDDDMLDGAALYAGEAQKNGRYESPVAIPDVHAECFGTPDWWRALNEPHIRQLKVIDYKYGHRYVEVFEHYQLVAYAMGVARFLQLPLNFPVVLVIVQPRNYTHGPIREWKTDVAGLYQICKDVIAPQVALALSPNPPTRTGRHCLDCSARHMCRTLATENESIVDFSGTAEAQDLSDEAIGQELRILKEAIKRLEARYTGLYEHASSIARNGRRVMHWALEAGQGRLQWKEDVNVDQVAGMGDALGVNLRKPTKLLTPTQAIKEGVDKTIIGFYAHRPPGAMRLVQDDTTRTRKIFGDNRT